MLGAEVFSPLADAHQVLGGDLATVRLLVEAGERLQRVEHHLAGRRRGGGGAGGVRTGEVKDVLFLEEVLAGSYRK